MRRPVAAALVTAVSLLVLVGPVSWLSVSLANDARSFAQRIGSGNLAVPPPPPNVRNWPVVGDSVYEIWYLASSNLKEALIQIGPQLKSVSGTVLGYAGSAGISMLQFLAAIFISGFLLYAGRPLVRSARSIIRRIAIRRGDEFADLAGATIRNLARGVIGISLLQALLAGIGLIIAGAPAPGLLSFLVLVFGIIQVGATPVLGPMIVWSWLTKDTTSALLFSLYMVPVGLLDNLLRPFVMAHGLKTPMLVILVGVIGGILAHGVIGLFIGPIVLAIAWELLTAWSAEGETAVRGAPPVIWEPVPVDVENSSRDDGSRPGESVRSVGQLENR
jgi:predicted PurR-regulated permease PerM